MFTVNVPKDWDKKRELIWTVTVNGKTERAVGWLQSEWEIDPVGGANTGGRTDEEYVKNRPPTITLAAVAPVKLPAAATLTATVADDGLPKPRGRGKPAVGQETPPTLQGGTEAPVNVPAINARAIRETPPGATAGAGAGRPQGPSVSWIVWRGPADARFSPRFAEPKDGRAVTTATFTQPGEYVLRAIATDTLKTSSQDVKVWCNKRVRAPAVCFPRVDPRFAIAWVGLTSSKTAPGPREAASNRPIQQPDDGYTSSDSCRACHPSEYATWHRSYHRTMTQVASPETVRADFGGVQVDAVHGRPMRLTRDAGRFFAEFDDPDWDGAEGAAPRISREVVISRGPTTSRFTGMRPARTVSWGSCLAPI
jgi:hypothetical protein